MSDFSFLRLATIILIAVTAHLVAVGIQHVSRMILLGRMKSESKVLTVTGFSTSVVIFSIYFAAFGFVLSELGISLATYLASASVIGLAVSFGSQGVVQDVINGLTVVFSDLIDVGDMVEIGGQIGIVESVGMRFTTLINFSGARVYVPNRSISNVSNYPRGYIRAFLDVRLPTDEAASAEAESILPTLVQSAYQQYPGILLLPPSVVGRFETAGDYRYVRIKFRIWPGQGALIEGTVKTSIVAALRKWDASYADWMVSVHYRAEPAGTDPAVRLPRPHGTRRLE